MPHYPDDLRAAHTEGGSVMEFVIDAQGIPMMSSVLVVSTTHIRFAEEVLKVLPSERFNPFEVGGCPVATMVRMPFEFALVY